MKKKCEPVSCALCFFFEWTMAEEWSQLQCSCPRIQITLKITHVYLILFKTVTDRGAHTTDKRKQRRKQGLTVTSARLPSECPCYSMAATCGHRWDWAFPHDSQKQRTHCLISVFSQEPTVSRDNNVKGNTTTKKTLQNAKVCACVIKLPLNDTAFLRNYTISISSQTCRTWDTC